MSKLEAIRPKIERAYKHIDELETAVIAFRETTPYAVGAKPDPNTGHMQYYVVEAKDVPIDISLIAGDILQNLRTALDHLAWQLVLAAGKTPDPGNTGFPVSDTAEKYKTESPRKVKFMRPEAVDAINRTKPYKGGNDILWRLHRLNNIDKHRLILTVVAAMASVDVFGHFDRTGFLPPAFKIALADRNPLWRPSGRVVPLKIGNILFTSPDTKVDDQLEFSGEITFNEPGICEGEPLLETLHGMADLVSHLIADFAPLL